MDKNVMKETEFLRNEKLAHIQLIENGFFEGATGEGYIYKKNSNDQRYKEFHKYILTPQESLKNLYAPIREDALDYFDRYAIDWWRANIDLYFPTGHLVSSQIHCLNHLFALHKDPDAVLAIIKPIGEAANIKFHAVLPSCIDTNEAYYDKELKIIQPNTNFISFEFACHNFDVIDEKCERRGAYCTSVDAMIRAQDEQKKNWLIPIEWKYTEAYNHKEEAFSFNRYTKFVDSNSRINEWNNKFKYDPLYELGRQTLFMEQLIATKPLVGKRSKKYPQTPLKADDFLHLIIIPNSNTEMNADAQEFRSNIKSDFQKLVSIVTPEDFLSPLASQPEIQSKYADLLSYLQTRYWRNK